MNESAANSIEDSTTASTAVPTTPSARRPRRWIRFLMWSAIFISGMVVGAVGHAIITKRTLDLVLKHPERIPDRLMPVLKSRLSLTPEQAEKVERIVRTHHRNMEVIRAESHPRMTAEVEALRADVSAELNEKQRVRWNAWCDFVEERFIPAAPVKATKSASP